MYQWLNCLFVNLALNITTNRGAAFDPSKFQYNGNNPFAWLAYKLLWPIGRLFFEHGLSFFWVALIFFSLIIYIYLYPYIFHKERTANQKRRDMMWLLILIPTWIFLLVVSILHQIHMNQTLTKG